MPTAKYRNLSILLIKDEFDAFHETIRDDPGSKS